LGLALEIQRQGCGLEERVKGRYLDRSRGSETG
jgi:hypothetical protein